MLGLPDNIGKNCMRFYMAILHNAILSLWEHDSLYGSKFKPTKKRKESPKDDYVNSTHSVATRAHRSANDDIDYPVFPFLATFLY